MLEWFGRVADKLPPRQFEFYAKLASDQRMREVWVWYEKARHTATHPLGRSSLSFCMKIAGAMSLPEKPGNMSVKQREKYFAKVRLHATALRDLLNDTLFDYTPFSELVIDQEKLADTVVRDLQPWGDDETGHVVAYWVDDDGVRRMDWDYPQSHFTELLFNVIEWTRQEDFWGRGGLMSSAPIGQANSPNMRTIYFNYTLYSSLLRDGISIPFALLATTANVALDLPAHLLVDEDTVRKQVRRVEARLRKEAPDKAF
ncbi:MAG TPA: hypothetical protein VNJ47_00250 [Nevskiales bacterium]|nr:hypothetical protein [Nevskiales bacterium]